MALQKANNHIQRDYFASRFSFSFANPKFHKLKAGTESTAVRKSQDGNGWLAGF